MIKQVIVARKDLKMPAGKLSAQVSHASLGCILNKKNSSYKELDNGTSVKFNFNDDEYEWLTETKLSKFTKIVLKVNSEKELLDVYNKAKEKDLNSCLIKDAGNTFFDEPTYTCVGIGPVKDYELNDITGNLKLY